MDKDKITKLVKKAKSLKDTGELGMAKELIEIQEKQEETLQAVKDIPEVVIPEPLPFPKIPEFPTKIEVVLPEGVMLKGDKGDSPTKKQLLDLIIPLIPAPMKGDDGDDAVFDEERIVNLVVEKIAVPKYEIPIIDTVEETIRKINELPIEEEFQIDASHIKNLPKPRGGELGGVVARNIYQLGDVVLDNLANGDILKWNAANARWQNGPESGGGGGSPGGGNMEVQFNDNGSFGGIGNTYYDGSDLYTAASSTLFYKKGDDTANFKFDVTAISTATTRILNVQDLDGTIALLGGLNNVSEFINDAGYITAASAPVLSVTGTANRITVSPTTGNVVVDIAATYVGQASITTLGTITTGTWNAGVIAGQYGGTGVANTGKTITLGGNLTTSGAFNSTFTMTGATSVTFPTSGTLATTSQLAFPAGSGTEIQYRSSSTAFGAVTGSSITTNGYMTLAPTASTTGSPTIFTITAPAHTTLTAATEAIDINLNLARTVQFTGGGTFPLQRAMVIQAPTYAATTSTTISEADTFVITGAPIAGTNMTITNPMALKVGTPGAFTNTLAAFGGSLNGYYEVIMQNTSSGTLASSDFVAQADNSTNSTNFVDMGITSSTFADTNFTLWGGADAAYLFAESTSLVITTMRAGAPLVFGTGGTLTANERGRMTDSTFALTPGVSTGSSSTAFRVTGAANTTVTASTNVPDAIFNFARTVQFATGAKTAQHAFQILAPTYSAVAATTITGASTLYVNAAPVAGTNVTITNSQALWIDSGDARFDGNLRFENAGTTANVNIGILGTETTGLNFSTTQVGFSTGGTTRWALTATVITGAGSGALISRNDGGAGTAANPTYGCANDTNTGYGFDGGDVSYFSNGGVRTMEMNASQNVGIGVAAASINSRLHLGGSFATAYVAKTANYTATISDYTINCTANTFQVTLPTAVGITGRVYVIVNSGAGTITIGTTSSQTFVNVTATPTTLTLATLGSYMVQSTGAAWMVI